VRGGLLALLGLILIGLAFAGAAEVYDGQFGVANAGMA